MLPIATQNDLGAIKVGAGLQAGDDGTLSVVGEGDAGNGLSMIVTYGSLAVDSTIPDVPANLVTVYGPPHMPVVLTTTQGASFVDGNLGVPGMTSIVLSDAGMGQARVSLPVEASERMASIVAAPFATPADNVDEMMLKALAIVRPAQCPTLFYPPMTDGSWNLLQSFGYTRGAPSDGVSPCVVTLLVDYTVASEAGITTLKMRVTSGDATFDNGAITANPTISPYGGDQDNGIATANVYCASPGVSTIEISVPGGDYPNEKPQAYVSFVAPPRSRG
jgi:hypothetical protein